jgi:hypothetical protein
MNLTSIIIPLCIFITAFVIYKCCRPLIGSFYIWLCIATLSVISIFVRPIIRYFILSFLILYIRNILLFFDFTYAISTCYAISSRKDNNIARNLVTDLFNRNFRLITNFEKIPKKPTIFVVNYVRDRVENLACVILPVNICPIIAKWLKSLGKLITPIIIRGDEKQYDNMKTQIKDIHDKGFYIFVYIEKCCSYINDESLGTIRNGIFNIAKDLDIEVTPIAFDKILYTYGMLKKQNYQICVGDTFKVENVNYSKYKTRRFLGDKIKYFKKTKFDNCY